MMRFTFSPSAGPVNARRQVPPYLPISCGGWRTIGSEGKRWSSGGSWPAWTSVASIGACLNVFGIWAGSVMIVAPSSLPTSWPSSVFAAAGAGAAGFAAAAAAGCVAAGAAAPDVGAEAGAWVAAGGAGVLQAARMETTPAPRPTVSSVRREIVVSRASGCCEDIPITPSQVARARRDARAQPRLRCPGVAVHGRDGSVRNVLVRFLPIPA